MSTGPMIGLSSGYRLVATDLDGTLLRPDGSISERTQRAVTALRDAGLTHVLASGRPPRSLRLVAERLGASGLAICCNGALIYDLVAGAIVHHAPMPAEAARALVEALRTAAPGVSFAIERGLEFGCEPAWLAARPAAREWVRWQAEAQVLCAEPITKLIALHPELPIDQFAALTASHANGDLAVTYSSAAFLEIASAGVDKGSALAWLSDRLGIAPAEAIAFGDMPNDLAMLRWAGRAVAVANAHPEVLAIAHEIAPANGEDGVASVLERLVGHGS